MFQVQVAWLDEQKSLARFSLPGRDEWTVEHITALMRLLGEIREQMSPAWPRRRRRCPSSRRCTRRATARCCTSSLAAR